MHSNLIVLNCHNAYTNIFFPKELLFFDAQAKTDTHFKVNNLILSEANLLILNWFQMTGFDMYDFHRL